MVAALFDISHLRPAAAVVAAHGITDLDSWRWPPCYAACCLLPMPPALVTTLFVFASVVHFSEDIGPGASFALHCMAGAATLMGGAQGGLEFMTGYLTCIHTPSHYLRCALRRRWTALVVALASTLVALALLHHVHAVYIGHAVQRLVVAHVLCEWAVSK